MRAVRLTRLSKQRHSQSHLNTLTESCFTSASLPLYSPPSLAPLLQSVNDWQFTFTLSKGSQGHWRKEEWREEWRTKGGECLLPNKLQLSPPVPQLTIRRIAARAVECSPAAFTWKYYSVLPGHCACCKSLALLEMYEWIWHGEEVETRRLWELHAERWLPGCCNTLGLSLWFNLLLLLLFALIVA